MSYPADTVRDMNSWHMHPRAAFDLETTGRDPLTARIVTASIILVDGRGEVLQHHEWLADPGVDIPAEATAVHGIATRTARALGAPVAQVVNQITEVLNGYFRESIPVLAFNARYDFTVLAREGLRHGVRTPSPFPVLDPYVMDKHADRYRRGKRTLTAMCAHYGVGLENAHTSAADVMATLGVGAILAERFQQLRRPAQDLHEHQVTWALRQAESFQEYLRRSDPHAVVEGEWPAIAS
jgi:DNA polymerase-3 subunit epsilon